MPDIYDIFLAKYGDFTEIQKAAMPIIEEGGNCVVVAPTGAGKTEAAVLPILRSLSGAQKAVGIRAIYITPLRALNRDMIKRLTWMCDKIGVSIAVRHGDTLQSERRKQEKTAPALLITTPETLQSILPTKSFASHLKNVEYVVVDEVHELYYNKRGAQLSLALERLEELSPGFKRIGISATVADPEVAGRFMCGARPFRVATVSSVKRIEISIALPQKYGKEVKELACKLDIDEKALARVGAIADAIKSSKSALVFANTRQVVEALGSRLLLLNSMHNFGGIGVHHGSLDRKDRIEMEERFKGGELRGMIATSSLELGIDIGDIDLVVQYGSPRQALRLVQRVGRSGHSVSGVARGRIIATSNIDAIEALSVYKSVKEGSIESFGVCDNALDVLCTQLCGIALDKKSVEVGKALEIIRRAYPYRKQDLASLGNLLSFMNRQRLLFFEGKTVVPSRRTRMYYYEHLSVIPDTRKFTVKSIADNRIISSLDERFVAANIEEGVVFIVRGLPWKVISIDEGSVSVEPSTLLDAAVPDWAGEDIPVCYGVARGAASLAGGIDAIKKLGCIDREALPLISEFCAEQQKFGTDKKDTLVVERVEEFLILHTGLGSMANEALSRLITSLIVTFTGRSVNVRSSPYFIMFESPRNISVKDLVMKINTGNLEGLLEEAVKNTELFRYRFVNVAKLFGIVERDAAVSKSLVNKIIRALKDTPVYAEALSDVLRAFDIPNLKNFLDDIQSNKIRIVESSEPKLSPVADEILNAAYYTRELMAPSMPSKAMLDSFSDYLLNKDAMLLCTYCGFEFTRKLSEIKDLYQFSCPSCGSVMICRNSDLHSSVVKKRLAGKKLDREGRGIFGEVMKEAGLFSAYGGRAALALATYGVGPASAARALLMHRKDESLFYKDLIEAQKQFIRTKKYWSAN